METTIKKGSTVTIHYTLRVAGKIVDSSLERDPLQFVHGEGQIIAGLEEALLGMGIGDRSEVRVPPEKAYGHPRPEAVQSIPLASVPKLQSAKVGDRVRGKVEEEVFEAVVQNVDGNEITLDLNHPLAGKTLDFEVEIVGVA